MPKKVLLASEMGVGAGHVAPLCVLAEALLALGCECHFVVPELETLRRLRPTWVERSVVAYREFPVWELLAQSPLPPPNTFADTLFETEFVDAERLNRKLAWCEQCLDEIRPDGVIGEFAPGMMAVAKGRVPTLMIGTGYSLLPAVDDLPPVAFWLTEVPATSRQKERQLLDNFNRVAAARGYHAQPSLAQLFRGDENFPCTFVSFDPYRSTRNEPCWLPLTLNRTPLPASVSREPTGRGFAYFSLEHPCFTQILQLLLSFSPYPIDVYAPPYRDRLLQALPAESPHRVLTTPLDLRELQRYRFCAHPGGLGVSGAAALARIPQLLSPVSLESLINAHALYQQRAATIRLPDDVLGLRQRSDFEAWLRQTLALPLELDHEFATVAAQPATADAILSRCATWLQLG